MEMLHMTGLAFLTVQTALGDELQHKTMTVTPKIKNRYHQMRLLSRQWLISRSSLNVPDEQNKAN